MDPLVGANEVIERQLEDRVRNVEHAVDADVLTYMGPIEDGVFDFMKDIIESISPKRKKLAVFLETGGGFIESAERMANLFRHHYRTVDFVVTSFAMSAGTVLVMSGDAIFMDYSSTLGPIDPQLQRPGSNDFLPALGYLEQFDRLVEKSARGELTTAELAYLIERFDPAELYRYEQARDLSIALLEEWLVKYKFKNWKETESRGMKVTPQMRRDRASEIGRALSDTKRWHSHARGITMEVLRRDLKLQIEDIEADSTLAGQIHPYTNLLSDYRSRLGHHRWITHWRGGYHGH